MRRWPVTLATVLLVAGCSSTPTASGPAHRPTSHLRPTPQGAHHRAPPRRLQVRWAPWRLPAAVGREAAVPLPDGHHVRVAGGLLPGDASTAASYRLDLDTGAVDRRTPLPVPVHDTAGVALRGRPLVIGGGNSLEQDVVQQPGRIVGHLPGARSDLSAVRVGGRVCVVGGYDGTSVALGAVLCSRTGTDWHLVAHLRLPVRYAAVVARAGRIWVLGGERAGAMVDTVQKVDPSTGSSRIVARLPVPVGHAAALVAGSRVLLLGGRRTEDRTTARMWWFDPASDRTRPAGRLPAPVADAAMVTEGGTAYLIGGEDPSFSRRVLVLRVPWLSRGG